MPEENKVVGPPQIEPAEEVAANMEEKQVRKELAHIVAVFQAVGLQDFIRYLKSPWRIMWINFCAGIFRGLGIVIGATVVIGVVIWVLTKFVDFPLIGQYFADLAALLEQFAPPTNGIR